jgi:hypothetical protein
MLGWGEVEVGRRSAPQNEVEDGVEVEDEVEDGRRSAPQNEVEVEVEDEVEVRWGVSS